MRALIDDGFPFTLEGYARASYLAKFGSPKEVATVHIQCITLLRIFLQFIPNKSQINYMKNCFSLCMFLIKWINWKILKCITGLLWINYWSLWVIFSDEMMSDKSGPCSSWISTHVPVTCMSSQKLLSLQIKKQFEMKPKKYARE